MLGHLTAVEVSVNCEMYSKRFKEETELEDVLYLLGGAVGLLSHVGDYPELKSEKLDGFVRIIRGKIEECKGKNPTSRQEIKIDLWKKILQGISENNKQGG